MITFTIKLNAQNTCTLHILQVILFSLQKLKVAHACTCTCSIKLNIKNKYSRMCYVHAETNYSVPPINEWKCSALRHCPTGHESLVYILFLAPLCLNLLP